MPANLLEQLREATRAKHAQTEAALALPEPMTTATYGRFLSVMLAAHTPASHFLELHRDRLPAASDGGRRVRALQADMSEVDHLPRAAATWQEPAAGGAVGVLYVVEGSSVGGRFLLTRVRRELPDTPCRFLSGDDDGGRRWRSVRDALAMLPPYDEAADAAVATFDLFAAAAR